MPITVWAHTGPATAPETAWLTPMITPLLDALTHPDDQVLLLPAPGGSEPRPDTAPTGSLAATEDTVREHGRRVETVLLDPSTAAAVGPSGSGVFNTAPTPGTGRDDPRTVAPDDQRRQEPAGADLVLTQLAPEATEDFVVDHLAMSAARLLAPGGVLAVLTHSDQMGGVLRDPTGAVVAAGQHADLLYLQHLVLLMAPIQHSQLTPTTSGEPATPPRHQPAHADALLFIQPTSDPS